MTPNRNNPPELSGKLLDGGHCLKVRVYFEDTDFSGIVYHASYIRFMERGRSDFMRLLGIRHSELIAGSNGESLAFAVRRLSVDYLKSAQIDDVLEVWTKCTEVTKTRIELDQEIRRDSSVLLTGKVSVVVINSEGKPRRLPPAIAALLKSDA